MLNSEFLMVCLMKSRDLAKKVNRLLNLMHCFRIRQCWSESCLLDTPRKELPTKSFMYEHSEQPVNVTLYFDTFVDVFGQSGWHEETIRQRRKLSIIKRDNCQDLTENSMRFLASMKHLGASHALKLWSIVQYIPDSGCGSRIIIWYIVGEEDWP